MKKILLITIFTVLILTGCTSKSFFYVTFDTFTIKLYNNNKQYTVLPLDITTTDMKVLTKIKEEQLTGTTGFINSLLIIRTVVQPGIDIKTLVTANAKKLQLKLLKYKAIATTSKKLKCPGLQYSGYITTFSYQLDKTILYEGQYFFTDDTSLYVVSLSSDNQKDINSFVKSINTLKCN